MSAVPVIDTVPLPALTGVARPALPDRSRFLRFTWRLGFGIAQVVFRARLLGGHHVPRTGPVVLCANHPTYFDPALVFLLMERRVHLMAWDALFRLPVATRFMEWGGAFPVKLGGKGREAVGNTLELLRAGRCVGIFPEGGRSSADGTMRPFHGGPATMAVREGAALVPVTINGAHRLWPRGRRVPRLGGPVRLVCHPPIVPPESGPRAARGALPAELTRQVRAAIASVYEGPVAPQP